MLTTIALAVGLLAVTAEAAPGTMGPGSGAPPRRETIQAPLPGSGTSATGGSSSAASADQSGECIDCNNCCCGRQRGRRRTTCNMLPHYAYISDWDFYYYFRPYNYIHIRPQQETVARWGGDVRNPYANEMFEKVYEGLEDSVRAGAKKPAPVLSAPVSDRRKPESRMRLGSAGGFSK